MTDTVSQAAGAREDVVDLSVVMPCLNEEDSVRCCVERAWRGIERTGLRGEVVVCDNGSVDRSVEVAERAGAVVVHQAKRGYGRACLTAIEASVGWMIVMGDSDCSYDFLELHTLIAPLVEGYDYVLGSRFMGTILPGAMPFLHRYVGNPVLTAVLNRLLGVHTSDAHSGMRAFTRSAYARMRLRCEGMEFASEIVIAAAFTGLRMTEVPITYHPRLGHSKLHPWRDGVRHLRFMFAEALFHGSGARRTSRRAEALLPRPGATEGSERARDTSAAPLESSFPARRSRASAWATAHDAAQAGSDNPTNGHRVTDCEEREPSPKLAQP